MSKKIYTASTILNHSPRKTRLIVNAIRNKDLSSALDILIHSQKPKSRKIYNLLISAANNLNLTIDNYKNTLLTTIVVEQAQKLVRIQPRAKGRAFKIRRRYSRIKVSLT